MSIQGKRRKTATKFERTVASDLGGRRIFLSGAGLEKGDVAANRDYAVVGGNLVTTSAFSVRVEAKTTSRSSYAVTSVVWFNHAAACDRSGDVPLLAVSVLHHGLESRLIVAREAFFVEMMGSIDHIPLPKLRRSVTIRPFTTPKDASMQSSSLALVTRIALLCPAGAAAVSEALCVTPYSAFMEAVTAARKS